ncbi:MAG: divergent polysaccharide deacetylase family protein [Sulfurimonas sp.]|uniref:divergent polysaccharide deacetylase family protein n=1 Tax=Sulfurimonas sp. TaxID=2022749 RepID=UPI0025ED46E1|nr:divergent polysaccharide deacetylase family protein [Sulfurimonas sp.]MCK9490862.1 divergent polysaccharide deacetylase family protein [Sulfurimonas sp.]
MAKRKKKQTKSSKILTYVAWILALVALILGSLVGGYYIGYEEATNDIELQSQSQKKKRLTMLKKMEEISSKKDNKSVNTRLKDVLDKESKKSIGAAAHEYGDTTLPTPPEPIQREVKRTIAKPKLAIIIDDVSVSSHVRAIKSLNLPLTMSFLPPSKFRPNSAKLAQKESIYMVHLPMEAQSFSAEEPMTLRISDSDAKIQSRIRSIKEAFPRVSYINNHTGSKFTSDEMAMNRLIYALKAQNIYFIDSRTTAETKAPKVMKNFGLEYVARDVFLDHDLDKESVKEQIKKAIKVAKTHGTAIAIGHPHANTLMALKESKHLFKEVELVYIDRLY